MDEDKWQYERKKTYNEQIKYFCTPIFSFGF